MKYGTSGVAIVSSLIIGLTVAALVAQEEGGGSARAARTPDKITTAKVARMPVKTVKVEVPIEKPARLETPAFRGEGLFFQRCSPCHLGEWRKGGQVKSYAPVLTGVFKDASPAREPAVRDFIRKGSLNMPGFADTFSPTEFDDLIAYLKTL